MARFHTEKNDRSWIGAHTKTANTIKRHAKLMAEYIANGMGREEASRKAFKDVTAKREGK